MANLEKCQLLIVGDTQVGKTSILSRYVNGEFNANYLATVGVDFLSKDVEYDGKKIRVKIYDTAGQERYVTLAKSFFNNAEGILIVYDVTNKETFDNLKFWIQSFKSYNNEERSLPAILVGNKIDAENREVNKEEGEELGRENGFQYFETSAKTGENIEEAIKYIVMRVLGNKKAKKESNNFKNSNNSGLQNKNDKNEENGCCSGCVII